MLKTSYFDYGIEIPPNKYKGEVDCICPKCSQDRKKTNLKPLRVNLDKQTFYCHHCGFTGGLPKENHTPPIVKTYKKPVWKNKTQLSDNVIRWFEGRKISQSTLIKMKIGEEKVWLPQTQSERNCIMFNYFRNEEYVNYKARDGSKNFALSQGAELILYNIDSLIGAKEAFIIEGEIDTLTLIECGIQREGVAVVGVPNGANLKKNNLQYIDHCFELFDNIDKIHIGTDNDAAGRVLREDLANRFGKERCDYVEWRDKKDPNEVLMAYGIEGVIECCSDKKEFPLEGIFRISDFSNDIDDMYAHGLDRGLSLKMGKIDSLIRFVKGYITVITGIPNHGKSDWLDQVVLKMMVHHDWRCAYYSPENKPTKLHFSKLARKLIGKNWFGEKRISELEKNAVKAFLEDKVYFVKPEKNFTLDTILESIKLLKLRRGIDCFVLDAWNRIEHKHEGKNETKYVNESLLKLDAFCELYNVHCFLVAHPVKMDKDKKTGQYLVPTLYNINGSSHFYNIVANGMSVYRDFNKGTTSVYVQKVKFSHWGEIGFAEYKYDKECGRYNEDSTPFQEDKTNWITNTQVQAEIPLEPNTSDIVIGNPDDSPF